MSTPLRDFSSDPGNQLLHGLAVKYQFPDYVLAATESDCRSEGYAVKCAQLAPEPRLPTHTKAATWLSYAAFMEQRNALPKEERDKIARFLQDRVERWDIVADINLLEATASSLEKHANETTEMYPVRNAVEAKAASVWLENELMQPVPSIKVADRIDLARKIAEWIEPSPRVKAAACFSGCVDGKKVAAKVRELNATHKNPHLESLAKVAEDSSPVEMQLHHAEAAVILEAVTGMPNSETFLKVSSDDPMVFLANGAVVPRQCFDDGIKSAALDAAYVACVTNVPELNGKQIDNVKLAESMSRSLADMFCDDLEKAGVRFEVRRPRDDFSVLNI